MNEIIHMDVDYGVKLAGTTSVCWKSRDQLKVRISEKGRSADAFLTDLFLETDPTMVFIDALLSLPGRYFNTPCLNSKARNRITNQANP